MDYRTNHFLNDIDRDQGLIVSRAPPVFVSGDRLTQGLDDLVRNAGAPADNGFNTFDPEHRTVWVARLQNAVRVEKDGVAAVQFDARLLKRLPRVDPQRVAACGIDALYRSRDRSLQQGRRMAGTGKREPAR